MASYEMKIKLQKLVDKASAKGGGVAITPDPCDRGKYCYTSADAPDVTIFGFRSQESAREHWLKAKLGPHIYDALLDVLSES